MRLACLLLLILRLLVGAGERGAADKPRVAMADTSFSLFVCLGTCLGYDRTELLGWGILESETLELCKESLGMGARALLGIVTLEFTLDSLRGTGSVDSKQRDEGGAGSWIQFRRLSWKGAVTMAFVVLVQHMKMFMCASKILLTAKFSSIFFSVIFLLLTFFLHHTKDQPFSIITQPN